MPKIVQNFVCSKISYIYRRIKKAKKKFCPPPLLLFLVFSQIKMVWIDSTRFLELRISFYLGEGQRVPCDKGHLNPVDDN